MTLIPLSRLLTDGRAPGTVVARTGGRIMTFARFRADVLANAARLTAAGCRRGLLATGDAYWGAVGLMALLHAGAEVVVAQNGQPGALASLRDSWDLILCDSVPDGVGPAMLLEPGDDGDGPFPAPLDPGLTLSFFTSGSTGRPKRIVKTLALLDAEAALIDAVLGKVVPAGARVHATVTHQHVYGQSFRLCWPLTSARPFDGATHVLWESAMAALEAGDALISSPAHLGRMAGLDPLPPQRRPGLVLSAGSPLPPGATGIAAEILGTPITEIFGSTETGAIAWRRHDRADPPWTPLPGLTVQPDETGRMQLASPCVPGGAFAGDDLIEIVPGGGFRLRGRADRIVKVEGKRISLAELEAQLSALPLVDDAAVLGLGEPAVTVGAVVVPSAAGHERLRALGPFRFGRLLRRALAETQEATGLPRRWRFVDRLPSAALGKRCHAELAALFDAEGGTGSEGERRMEPGILAIRPLPEGVALDLGIDHGLGPLQGHFPNLPIVPGVALVDWAVKLGSRHLDLQTGETVAFQVKFRRVVAPGRPVTLVLRISAARRGLVFEYRSGDELLTSGSIRWEPS